MKKIYVSFYAATGNAAIKYMGKKKVCGYSQDFLDLLSWIKSGNSLHFKRYKIWVYPLQVRKLINVLNWVDRAGGRHE